MQTARAAKRNQVHKTQTPIGPQTICYVYPNGDVIVTALFPTIPVAAASPPPVTREAQPVCEEGYPLISYRDTQSQLLAEVKPSYQDTYRQTLSKELAAYEETRVQPIPPMALVPIEQETRMQPIPPLPIVAPPMAVALPTQKRVDVDYRSTLILSLEEEE